MKILAIMLLFVGFAFAADPQPAPKPVPPPITAEQKIAILQAESQVLTSSANFADWHTQVSDLKLKLRDLQDADSKAQAALLKATQTIFDNAGDPKHERFSFDLDKLELNEKTAAKVPDKPKEKGAL